MRVSVWLPSTADILRRNPHKAIADSPSGHDSMIIEESHSGIFGQSQA